MTYNAAAVTDAVIAFRKPITLQQGRALRDNPIAIVTAETGAPYVLSQWHPYNGATVGDGLTGRIWSLAVDGIVTSFETPAFEDGFEYRLMMWGLSPSSTGGDLQARMRRQSDDGFGPLLTIATFAVNSSFASAYFETMHSRREERYHLVHASDNLLASYNIGATSKVKSVEISITGSGNGIDAGEAILYRRRVYA